MKIKNSTIENRISKIFSCISTPAIYSIQVMGREDKVANFTVKINNRRARIKIKLKMVDEKIQFDSKFLPEFAFDVDNLPEREEWELYMKRVYCFLLAETHYTIKIDEAEAMTMKRFLKLSVSKDAKFSLMDFSENFKLIHYYDYTRKSQRTLICSRNIDNDILIGSVNLTKICRKFDTHAIKELHDLFNISDIKPEKEQSDKSFLSVTIKSNIGVFTVSDKSKVAEVIAAIESLQKHTI